TTRCHGRSIPGRTGDMKRRVGMRFGALTRATAAALVILVFGTASAALGATPPAATITPSSGPLTWQGAFYPLAGNVYAPGGQPTCEGDPGAIPGVNTCDVLELTVNVPAGYWSSHHGGVSIDIAWGDSNNDFDMFVYRKPAS